MSSDDCKWCAQGECWTHGQIERPAGKQGIKGKGKGNGKGKLAKRPASGGGGGGGAMAGGKGAMMTEMMMGMMMGGKGGGGKGQMMGQMMQMMMGADAAGGEGGAQKQALSWKGELNTAFAKEHKESPSKDTFTYATIEADGGYACTLSCEQFAAEYEGEGVSKKAAEDSAAEAAVKGEFPSYVKKVNKAKAAAGNHEEKVEYVHDIELLPWRAQLNQAFQRKHKTVTKESLVYATEQVEGDQNTFVSQVASDQFDETYEGAPGKGKKGAEDNAAMKAMEAEFPEDFTRARQVVPMSQKGFKRKINAQKRKRDEDGDAGGAADQDAKSRLNSAMSLLLAPKSVTKGMFTYAVADADDQSVATLTITAFGKPQTFTGEAEAGTSKASKKQAENSAAQAAYAAFKDKIAAAEKVHAEKKAVKDEAHKAEWKVLLAQKKEKAAEEKAAKKAKTEA